MKYNDIGLFLDALHDRIEELESAQAVTSSTDINSMDMSNFSYDEIEQFDSLFDEARAICKNPEGVEEYMVNRLMDLGYSDDAICQILDYEGV